MVYKTNHDIQSGFIPYYSYTYLYSTVKSGAGEKGR